MMNSPLELTREGSQLWNPSSAELTQHAKGLANNNRHTNHFPPSRHCTEQFTGPAGPNPNADVEFEGVADGDVAMIDFTAPNVKEQIEESTRALEKVGESRGGFPVDNVDSEGEGEAQQGAGTAVAENKQQAAERRIHNPYSINKVFLKVDPETLAIEQREQSDYFEVISANLRKHNKEKAPEIRTFNQAGIVFMPPHPPSVDSFDVFVKGGADAEYADTLMTNVIYRWYALCSTNVVTYRNWYTAVNGPMGSAEPPNPNDFTDLADWCFEAERWWESLFSSHQALRHHSRSAAIAAGVAAPHATGGAVPRGAPSPQGGRGLANNNNNNNNGIGPSKRAHATAAGGVPQQQQQGGVGRAPHAPAPAGHEETRDGGAGAAPSTATSAEASRFAKIIGGSGGNGGGNANYLPHNAGAPSFKRVV